MYASFNAAAYTCDQQLSNWYDAASEEVSVTLESLVGRVGQTRMPSRYYSLRNSKISRQNRLCSLSLDVQQHR